MARALNGELHEHGLLETDRRPPASAVSYASAPGWHQSVVSCRRATPAEEATGAGPGARGGCASVGRETAERSRSSETNMKLPAGFDRKSCRHAPARPRSRQTETHTRLRIPTEPATYSDLKPATLIDAAPGGLWARRPSFTYVLLCAVRRIGLAHTQFADATCGTIRLQKLGGDLFREPRVLGEIEQEVHLFSLSHDNVGPGARIRTIESSVYCANRPQTRATSPPRFAYVLRSLQAAHTPAILREIDMKRRGKER